MSTVRSGTLGAGVSVVFAATELVRWKETLLPFQSSTWLARGLQGEAAYAGAVAATAITGTVHAAARVTVRRVGRGASSVAVAWGMVIVLGAHGSRWIQLMVQ